MKIISIVLILTGLYLFMNDDSQNQEKKIKHRPIYKGKHLDPDDERLVEVIDSNYDLKHPKKF
jgi:hypothetical protein